MQTALATSVTISLYRTLLRVLSLRKFQLQHLSPGFLAGLLAGLAFAIHPADTRRVTVTIYFLTRTLEFCYNLLDDKGILPREKPWWFGSWLIFPLSSAQLLHAFVFDRDCFPQVTSLPPYTNLLAEGWSELVVGLRGFYFEIFFAVYERSTGYYPRVNTLARSLSSRRFTRHHLPSQLPQILLPDSLQRSFVTRLPCDGRTTH